MTRVLFIGDLAPTGFGTVTTDLGRALLDVGVDVRFLSQNELPDLPEPFASRAIVLDKRMGWHDAANLQKLPLEGIMDGTYAKGWQPDVILILGDFYAARGLTFMAEEPERIFRRVPTFHYCPIEGVGLPPSWLPLWEIVRPVAMSNFGADQIEGLTGKRPPMIYHGVDTRTFHPATPSHPIRLGAALIRSKDEAKAYFKIPPGWQMLLRTDTNVPRKMWPSLVRAMEPVLEAHPQAVFLMHTRSADDGGDLRDIWSHVKPAVRRRMVSTGYKDRGLSLSRADLCALYNAADVYVSSSAEGFGLTIAEAMACGVPAVGMDYSSVPEVIGSAGRVVPVEHLIDNPYAHKWAKMDEAAFAVAVNELLDGHHKRERLGERAAEHVRRTFQWQTAARQFAALFEGVTSKRLEAVA